MCEGNKKNIVLGIDTGGTYTDGVLLDVSGNKVIAKSKANTTKEDLSIGIGKCIELLNVKEDISLVCLSTTLATNSVVEGKIQKVGLIMMHKYDIERSFEADIQFKVKGIVDIKGDIEEDIDEDEIRKVLQNMKGKIDALVISGYLSVRNPAHELRIKEIALDIMETPIICAHELSTSLGYDERTDTAVLNAHLMPVIDDLLKKTAQTLSENGINADIAVIKGDGTMMNVKEAMMRPVETVLSGPAASVVGGAYLNGITDADDVMFVDLGGTTTDIALMKDGRVSVTDEGATINGWKTKVKAVDIHTFGLGGDSRLVYDGRKYSFGPMKAIPLCFANEKYPYLADEILEHAGSPVIKGFHDTEALVFTGHVKRTYDMEASERKVYDIIKDGPHSITYIAKHLSVSERILGISSMLKKGLVHVISITPTDIMHAAGKYEEWDAEASRSCIELFSSKLKLSFDETIDALTKKFLDQLAFAVIKSGFAFDGNYDNAIVDSEWMYNILFESGDNSKLKIDLQKKIVAIGAPAHAWITLLADRLGAEILVPENHEVANAIGAAKGQINRRVEIIARLEPKRADYRVYMPWGMAVIENYDEVKIFVQKEFEKYEERMKAVTDAYEFKKKFSEKVQYLDPDLDTSVVYSNTFVMELTAAPKYFM